MSTPATLHEIPTDASGVRVAMLPNVKKTLALAFCPGGDEVGQANVCVTGAADALLHLERLTVDLAADKTLSENTKTARIETARREALIAASKSWAALDAWQRDIAEREAALFAPPKIAPENAAEAIEDGEIRRHARSLSGPELAQFMQMLTDGQHERIVLALCRSPIPMGAPEIIAKQAWRDAVAAQKPDVVAALASQRNAVEWARPALARIGELAVESSALGRTAVTNIIGGAGVLDGLPALGYAA